MSTIDWLWCALGVLAVSQAVLYVLWGVFRWAFNVLCGVQRREVEALRRELEALREEIRRK